MTRRTSPILSMAVVLALSLGLAGCAMTREGQLRAKSDRIASELTKERQRVLDAPSADRDARLSHLNTLRTTLSAANIGLGSTRYLPETDRDMAFDVIEEALATIEWNIPLGPRDQLKQMPSQFQDGTLRLR